MSENEQHAARLERLIGLTEVLAALDSAATRDALADGAAALREIDTLRAQLDTASQVIWTQAQENTTLRAQLTDALTTLTAIRDQTYTDADGPELRAQNEANHRRAVEVLARMGE